MLGQNVLKGGIHGFVAICAIDGLRGYSSDCQVFKTEACSLSMLYFSGYYISACVHCMGLVNGVRSNRSKLKCLVRHHCLRHNVSAAHHASAAGRHCRLLLAQAIQAGKYCMWNLVWTQLLVHAQPGLLPADASESVASSPQSLVASLCI